jgi:hypothetical protein
VTCFGDTRLKFQTNEVSLMKVFLVYVQDLNYCQLLPKNLDSSVGSPNGRIKVMAFPPLGIQTLAPILRQHGHDVIMYDTCHPDMQVEQVSHAAQTDHPDVMPCLSCPPPRIRH